MIELFTEQYDPERVESTILKSVDTNALLYPDHPLDFLVYRIHRYTQLVRKERDKGFLDNSSRRAIWKQFENYKISSGGPNSGRTTIWDKKWGEPPLHVYRTVPPISTAYASYWYWTTSGAGPLEPFGEAGKHNLPTSVSGGIACPPFLVPQDSGNIVAPPSGKNEMCNRALKAMLPSIKEELSSLNSLIELKDFKSVPGLLKQLTRASFYSRLIKNFEGWGKVSPPNSKTLKEFASSRASNYLQWKFAVAPLISDIAAIHAALTSYKKRINALVTGTGGTKTRHFTLHFDEFVNSIETKKTGFLTPFLAFNGCVIYEVERKITYEPSTFHAQIQYNYNYTKYQQQHAATLALLDSLGLNFNPSIIWNAIPWSFVVDWVLKVGDALDRFTIQNMEPQINIHQFLWSIKRKRFIELRSRPDADAITQLESLLDRSWNSLPLVREEAYGRFLDYPVDAALVQASGINSSEFTLGAALIVANKGRSRGTRRK